MLLAIVVTGVAVAWQVGGVHPVFDAASRQVSNTMSGSQLRFSMSTMLFQSLGFYLMPFAAQISSPRAGRTRSGARRS